jgi:hypothetical protein
MSSSHDTSEQLPLPFTIAIQLTKGYTAIVDLIDADLAELKWYSMVDKHTCYARRNKPIDERRVTLFIHQVILARMLGRDLARGEKVDHIDLDGLNNRRSNLRLATSTENARNQRIRKNNMSGYKGVCWDKINQKWVAQIRLNGKSKHLGLFDTPEAAHRAYCAAATEYFGEFARFE